MDADDYDYSSFYWIDETRGNAQVLTASVFSTRRVLRAPWKSWWYALRKVKASTVGTSECEAALAEFMNAAHALIEARKSIRLAIPAK